MTPPRDLWGSSMYVSHHPFVCVGHDPFVRDMARVYVRHDSFVGGTLLALVTFGGGLCMFHTTRLHV